MTARARPLVLVLSNPLDDGKLHVTLLRLALMQRGYAVIVVHSVEGARTMLRERAVDALLVTLELGVAADLVRDLGAARPSTTIAFAPTGEGHGEDLLVRGVRGGAGGRQTIELSLVFDGAQHRQRRGQRGKTRAG